MARDSSTKRVYRVSRGENYSCLVTVIGDETILITDTKVPPGTSDEVLNTLLDDAEREAIKAYNKELGTWSSS